MTRLQPALVFLLCTLALLLAGPAAHAAPDARRCPSDCRPRIGVMAAFGQEADLLRAGMRGTREIVVNGNHFYTGELGGNAVVLVLSGVGMPNAIMMAQLMIDHFRVRRLVFSGIAGGVAPRHHIGDVVVPRSWILPQETYYAPDDTPPRPCGPAAGDLSCLGLALAGAAPYQGLFPRKTNVLNDANQHQVALTDSTTGAPIAHGDMQADYPADPAMLAVLERAADAIRDALEPVCRAGPGCAPPALAIGGRGASGNMFLANPQYRDYLDRQLGVDCVDMETAGVAHVAAANGVPFIGMRSVSDLAGDDSHPQEVGRFFGSGIAQRNAARVTLGFLQAWARQAPAAKAAAR